MKHTGLGITSTVLGALNILIGMIVAPIAGTAAIGMLMGGFNALNGPDGGAMILGLIGLLVVLFFLFVIMVLGLVFGIIGIVQKKKKKLFGIIGTSLNGAFLLLLVGSAL